MPPQGSIRLIRLTMAFAPSDRKFTCMHPGCTNTFSWFKCSESWRPWHLKRIEDEESEAIRKHAKVLGNDDVGRRRMTCRRVCYDCELQYRLDDWADDKIPEEIKAKKGWDDWETYQRLYANERAVRMTSKLAWKGQKWVCQGKALTAALAEISAEKDLDPEKAKEKSRKQWSREVWQRAGTMAPRFLLELRAGNLVQACLCAGQRMLEAHEIDAECNELMQRLDGMSYDDPAYETVLQKLEIAQEKYEKAKDYKTFKEKGDKQPEFLKAMDFDNQLGPNLRIWNVCRSKKGPWNDVENKAGTCGLCFPDKLWHQPNKSRWQFFCNVDWSELVKAAQDPDCNEEVGVWASPMIRIPHICTSGCRYVYKRMSLYTNHEAHPCAL